MTKGTWFVRALIVAVLTVTCAFGISAPAFGAAEDQPPGVSPVQPSFAVPLDAAAHPNYFARFSLAANQQISLTALSDPGLEVDMAVWDAKHPVTAPGASKALATDVQRGVSSDVHYNRKSSAPSEIWVQLRAVSGSGTVGVSWLKRDATSLRQKVSTTKPAYGKSATISGTFYDLRTKKVVKGASVTLWKSPDLRYWTRVKSTTTNKKGSYAFKVKTPALMYYRTSSGGTRSAGLAFSKTHQVMPRSYLGVPRVAKTVRRDTNWKVSGDFKPRHVAGSRVVKLYFYRKIGKKWKLKKTYTAVSSNYKSYSRYGTTATLPTRGAWRVRAYHASHEHSGAYSGWRHFTVK